MSLNEADTCRQYVLPKLQEWDTEPHFLTEQYYIDAGRILTTEKVRRRKRKFADYLLCYSRDFPLAVRINQHNHNEQNYRCLLEAHEANS